MDLRLLCLHGKYQTKEIFRSRLGKLVNKLRSTSGANCVFVDGTYDLEMRPGDMVPPKTWWKYSELDKDSEINSVDETLLYLQKVWKEQGPFQGLIGFSMGGTLAVALASRRDLFPGLKFVVVGGAPACDNVGGLWEDPSPSIALPSLHVIGKADQLISSESSMKLSNRFENPQYYEHEQGHCFPSNAAFRDACLNFASKALEARQAEPESSEDDNDGAYDLLEIEEQQRDELEALEAIYPDRMNIIQPLPKAVLAFKLECAENEKLHQKLTLVVSFTKYYPMKPPKVKLTHEIDMLNFPNTCEKSLLNCVRQEVVAQEGMPCVFSAISAAETWLEDPENLVVKVAETVATKENVTLDDLDDDDDNDMGVVEKIWEMNDLDEVKENELVEEATTEACRNLAERMKNPKQDEGHVAEGRGVKKFVVGLVGKPSAGKSTFFCCATRLQTEAKVAPHPFTTIDPNFGVGWWASNDKSDLATFSSQHGRDAQGRRLLPLVIKDVAGLIPGAYKGHGKGNRFLNDLCDADVLIHVVDVSGSSDKNGVQVSIGDASASSASEDMKWVREELHRWIFGNVATKWRSVVRASRASGRAAEERLLSLFTGYQGTRSTLKAAAFRANLDLCEPQLFTRADLHRLVAHFLSVRFPMCLALNKCDILLDKVDGHVGEKTINQAQAIALEQGYGSITCSAMLESTLLSLAKQGVVDYQLGGTGFEIKDADKLKQFDPTGKISTALESATSLLDRFGTTGVTDCISTAIHMRHPILVYPVSNLKTGSPVEVGASKAEEASLKFRDCLQALPGSTVEDVFAALKRGVNETYRIDGDFIRAETTSLVPNSPIKQCGKESQLDKSMCVIKLLTNRKVVWQQKLR
mmetsp:Transcript_10517/g.19682  ORF Transcript_10517/g.19682 Transcript_10517/m.19682 type:complete len:867 (-) Transcript_10517:1093-3693(-)